MKVVKVAKIVKECESVRVTVEYRHANKSCSACLDRVEERVKVLKVVKVFQVFQNIPGSQLLSDIQNFFFKCHIMPPMTESTLNYFGGFFKIVPKIWI